MLCTCTHLETARTTRRFPCLRLVWTPHPTHRRAAQRQPGAAALGSKLPVHVAQLDADWWHHPVPSSPQSPQSAPNRQQPPLPPPPPPPPCPEIAPFMYRPEAVSSPSDQPPFV